jgi:hypothetical protein
MGGGGAGIELAVFGGLGLVLPVAGGVGDDQVTAGGEGLAVGGDNVAGVVCVGDEMQDRDRQQGDRLVEVGQAAQVTVGQHQVWMA